MSTCKKRRCGLQTLMDGAKARGIPVVQIFHMEPEGVFAPASGQVRTMEGLPVAADAVFEIRRLIISGIRTEQCCETTARATLTFAMTDQRGRIWSAEEIKARTELVLDGRFGCMASVEEVLAE